MSDGPGCLKQHGKANSAANKSVSIFAEKYDTAEVLSEEMVLRWNKASRDWAWILCYFPRDKNNDVLNQSLCWENNAVLPFQHCITF